MALFQVDQSANTILILEINEFLVTHIEEPTNPKLKLGYLLIFAIIYAMPRALD